MPESQVILRPHFRQILTPSLKKGGLNEVFGWEVSGDQPLDLWIDSIVAAYKDQGVRFRWTVPPQGARSLAEAGVDLGPEIAQGLLSRGFFPYEVAGLVGSTDLPVALADAVRVSLVTAAEVDLFSEVMAAGWGCELLATQRLNRHVIQMGQAQRLYLAYHKGQPAGCAAMAVLPNSVYLLGGVVLPAFRGQGVYRALLHQRLVDAAVCGRSQAIVHAIATTSAPILQGLGFHDHGRFFSYAYAPPIQDGGELKGNGGLPHRQ